MKRLMASAIVCVINCVVILGQQASPQSFTPIAPVPTVVQASDILFDAASPLLLPHFTFGQSQTSNLRTRTSGQATELRSPFVVLNGAVFMRLAGEQFLVPVSGGGASGCFSLNLPQRIKKLTEFAPKLDTPPPQRCGDYIYFFFNDHAGRNIDPAMFESITIVDSVVGDHTSKDNAERRGMKGFTASTRCGLREMKVTVAYQTKKMDLILKRIPGDSGDIFLYSLPFSDGTFMFDFEDDLHKTCDDNEKGRQGECTISSKRLKKTNPG